MREVLLRDLIKFKKSKFFFSWSVEGFAVNCVFFFMELTFVRKCSIKQTKSQISERNLILKVVLSNR